MSGRSRRTARGAPRSVRRCSSSAAWPLPRVAGGRCRVLDRGPSVERADGPWSSGPIPGPRRSTSRRQGSNARTKVHEYGGGAFVVHRGTSSSRIFTDQRLYRHGPDGTTPTPITPGHGRARRYADGRVTADGDAVICVRERHEDDGEWSTSSSCLPPDGRCMPRVDRRRAATSSRTPASRPTARSSRGSPGTCRACPGTALSCGSRTSARTVRCSNDRLVAGEAATESILQPEWSPAGVLHFASDRTGWWNLYRVVDGRGQRALPDGGRVRVPAVGVRRRSLRVLRRRADRLHRTTRNGDRRCWRARPGDRGAAGPRSALHAPCIGARPWRWRGRRSRSWPAPPTAPRSSSGWTSPRDPSTSCAQRGDAVRSSVRVGAVARSSSRPTAGSRRSRIVYPPANPDFAGPAGRAPAADRDEPRGTDG